MKAKKSNILSPLQRESSVSKQASLWKKNKNRFNFIEE